MRSLWKVHRLIVLAVSAALSALAPVGGPAFAANSRMAASAPRVASAPRIDVRAVDARGRPMSLERLTPAERESIEGLRRAVGEWAAGTSERRIRISLDCDDNGCVLVVLWVKKDKNPM